MQGIGNDDPLVKIGNFWTNEEQECCGADYGAPENCCESVMEAFFNNRSSAQSSTEHEETYREEVITSRTKDLRIVHVGSFSRNREGSAR